MHPRKAIGQLASPPPKVKWIGFQPRDSRFPRVRVSLIHCPIAVLSNPKAYENVLFEVTISEWTNVDYANGIITEIVGKVCNFLSL